LASNTGRVSTITLIRHGETTWNAERRVQGQLEAPLSARGLLQAAALANRIGREEFDAIYASDLSRARQTAECIAAVSGAEVRLDARLRERHYGVFQGLTWSEIKAGFPDDYARYRTAFPGMTIPGGEAVDAFAGRVLAVLGEIAQRHRHALVVAHGGLVDVLYRHANGIALTAPREHDLPNAGINRFVFDGVWRLESFADTAHLEDLDAQPDV
jgi:2,3-bisphosphoglycerate-dependent phosphoglycerate mutase